MILVGTDTPTLDQPLLLHTGGETKRDKEIEREKARDGTRDDAREME
jgi:hypothetical protein